MKSFALNMDHGVTAEEIEDKLTKEIQSYKRPVAQYKIEVAYSWNRKSNFASPGMIRIWRANANAERRGYDEAMAWCGYQDCGKPLMPEDMGGGFAFCRSCNRPLYSSIEDKKADINFAGPEKAVQASVKMFNLTPQSLSILLTKIWRDLNSDADFYIRFFKSKIRYDKDEIRVGEHLQKARTNRQYVLYSSQRLLQDVLSGGDPSDKILGFLRA